MIDKIKYDEPAFLEMLEAVNQRGISDLNYFGAGVEGMYRMLQNAHEYAAFLAWTKARFPNGIDNFLEIGTATGGSIRTLYELVGFNRAVSIDLDAEGEPSVQKANLSYIPKNKHTLFTMDSHTMRAHLALRASDLKYDLAFIDGDHHGPGLQMDIDLALAFMKPHSYIVFHDVDSEDWVGVRDAIQYKEDRGYIHLVAHFLDQKSSSFRKMGIGVYQVAMKDYWPKVSVIEPDFSVFDSPV